MTVQGLPVESAEPAEEWASIERFEPGHSNVVVTALSCVAALGGFLFGYDSSVINGAVAAIGTHFAIGAGALGFAVASALLGAAVGAMVAGRVADRLGRLWAMRVAAVLFFISALGTGLAPSLTVLIIFRIVGGIGVGAASVIAPAYIAEIAPARIRGRLGSLQQLAIVLGIFAALLVDYIIGTGLASSPSASLVGMQAWRWMFLAMVVPAVIYGIGAFFIPESPRYLVVKDRLTEAGEVMRRVLGNVNIPEKVREIQDTIAREVKPSLRDLRGPAMGLLPIVWVGIALSVFQQFVGINVIFYYSSVLWHAVGFSTSDSLLISVITSVVNIVSTLIAISLIDRSGRKPLLVIGSVGMTLSLGVMALIFGTATVKHGQPSLTGAAGPIALIAANLFVVFFAVSWGPVVWVMLGEKFPNRIRAAALSVAAAAQWVANWAISTSFPSLKNAGLGLAYGIYAFCALLSLVFVLRFITETKGMELEEMTEDIRGVASSP
jgi:MFS transporter, SP family, sugar:H+ symporter